MRFLDECHEFAGEVWHGYVNHPWIEALFSGTLAGDRFRYWMAQDLSFIFNPVNILAVGKCPPHNPWAERSLYLFASTQVNRIEGRLLEEHGEFAKSKWAARPAREGMSNFLFRAATEGSFAEYACAAYACSAFTEVFAKRFEGMDGSVSLPEEQAAWVRQFAEPWERETNTYLAQAINEAGESATEWQRQSMKWYFLRGVQHQILTFDAAWKMNDPWPGEPNVGQGVLAGPR